MAVCRKPASCGGALNHHRVVRGGSWNNNERNARSSYRNRNNPNNFNNNIGFRVVVCMFFPLLCIRSARNMVRVKPFVLTSAELEEWRRAFLAAPENPGRANNSGSTPAEKVVLLLRRGANLYV
jgi:hypothetical protein